MKEENSDLLVRIVLAVVALAACVGLALLCGCKSFYENSGSSGKAGSVTAPIELSDGTDSFTMKLLYGMEGASWYTRKDSRVKATYHNVYTNSYIGCVEKRGNQLFEIEIEPLYTGECVTNESSEASASTDR